MVQNSQNKKRFNDKEMKLICSLCNVFTCIKVQCNQCLQKYCYKCWHTFSVNDFGYRPYKNGCYSSNRCGRCVQEWKEGFAKDEEYTSDYIPEIVKNDNGTWTDELSGKTYGTPKEVSTDDKIPDKNKKRIAVDDILEV